MYGICKILIIICSVSSILGVREDPDVRYPCDGNLFGITDLEKHSIIPPEYSRIDYLEHGLFLAWSVNATDRFVYGTERFVFNTKGIQLKTKVPDGCRLVQVLWLGANADKQPNITLETLPQDTLLRFAKDDKFGICTTNGEIVLPAEYNFIGKASEGKVFITGNALNHPIDEGFYIFDCNKYSLIKLPYRHSAEMQDFYFSDGLAALKEPSITDHGRQNLVGYIDGSGQFVIEPQFVTAGPFRNGMASVTLVKPRNELPREVVIDISGKTISPANMEVQQYYGEYAAARDIGDRDKYGLVTRKFEYLIEPQYLELKPNMPWKLSLIDRTPLSFASAPFSYSADVQGQSTRIISSSNRLLFKLPPRSWVQSVVGSEFLRCRLGSGLNKSNPWGDYFFYFNTKGEALDYPYEEISDGHHVWYRPMTNDRLAQLVDLDDGRFDSDYWKREHKEPIQRREMFGRLLQDYNLIGMSEKKFLSLLGPGTKSDNPDPDAYSYLLQVRGNQSVCLYAVFHMTHKRVSSWMFLHAKTAVEPITSNVILQCPKDVYEQPESLVVKTRSK